MKQYHSIVRKETANHFKHNAFLQSRAVCGITVLTHITIFLLLEIGPLISVSAFTFSENFRQGLENILKRGQVGIQSL